MGTTTSGPTHLDAASVDVSDTRFRTNDAGRKLGGNPYDNSRRFYFGPTDDLRLNIAVPAVQC